MIRKTCKIQEFLFIYNYICVTGTLPGNLFTSCRLIHVYSQPPLRVLHLLLERSQEYHQQFARCKMSATLKLLYLITVKSGLNEKLTEWTDWQDERQRRAMPSPLPAALWNPKCTAQWLCRSPARPWATEKMYEDGLMFSYSHSEKPSNKVSNSPIKCEKGQFSSVIF